MDKKKTGASSQAINGCLLLFRYPIEVNNASAGSGESICSGEIGNIYLCLVKYCNRVLMACFFASVNTENDSSRRLK